VSKAKAAIDHWAREILRSAELRIWLGHDPARLQQLRRRLQEEELARLSDFVRVGAVILAFAARDEVRNDAVVLREVLLRQSGPDARPGTSFKA